MHTHCKLADVQKLSRQELVCQFRLLWPRNRMMKTTSNKSNIHEGTNKANASCTICHFRGSSFPETEKLKDVGLGSSRAQALAPNLSVSVTRNFHTPTLVCLFEDWYPLLDALKGYQKEDHHFSVWRGLQKRTHPQKQRDTLVLGKFGEGGRSSKQSNRDFSALTSTYTQVSPDEAKPSSAGLALADAEIAAIHLGRPVKVHPV